MTSSIAEKIRASSKRKETNKKEKENIRRKPIQHGWVECT